MFSQESQKYNTFCNKNFQEISKFSQSIIDTIGTIDNLIEIKQNVITKIEYLLSLKFKFETILSPTFELGNHIAFVKGKIKDSGNKYPYINMDYVTNTGMILYAGEGIYSKKEDVLLLMDGAASGTPFIGFEGIVGSTFCKINCDEKINPFLLYLLLKENEDYIKSNPTGSAIPHTDKDLVRCLHYPITRSEFLKELNFIFQEVMFLREKIRTLSKIKSFLLSKYF